MTYLIAVFGFIGVIAFVVVFVGAIANAFDKSPNYNQMVTINTNERIQHRIFKTQDKVPTVAEWNAFIEVSGFGNRNDWIVINVLTTKL